jgi:hypothetical protein
MDPQLMAAMFGGAGGGGAGPAGPATSGSGGSQYGTGWVVSTGGGSANGIPTWMLWAGAALLVVYLVRRK